MNKVLFCVSLAVLLASATLSCATRIPQSDGDSLTDFETGGVSLKDIVLLAQNNISDQTIMTFLANRRLDFTLDAQALLTLREAGVSEEVIQYLWEQEFSPEDPSYLADIISADDSPGYAIQNYPKSYYSSGYIGRSTYPLGWYYHHYPSLDHSIIYSYSPLHSYGHHGGHTLNHPLSHALVHSNDVPHASNLPGGHESNRNHSIRHRSSTLNQGTRHHSGHSGGSTGRHTSGHSTGHSTGHSGGHGGRHSSGH